MYVDKTKTAKQFEEIVLNIPPANRYCTDGNLTYKDVAFPGRHVQNFHNKSDTHNWKTLIQTCEHTLQGLLVEVDVFFAN